MDHHGDATRYTAADGDRWKATCSCGWQSETAYETRQTALEVADRHAREAQG
jgi:hypothetical protein